MGLQSARGHPKKSVSTQPVLILKLILKRGSDQDFIGNQEKQTNFKMQR